MRAFKVAISEGTADAINGDLIQSAILIITLPSACDKCDLVRECVPRISSKIIAFLMEGEERSVEGEGFSKQLTVGGIVDSACAGGVDVFI